MKKAILPLVVSLSLAFAASTAHADWTGWRNITTITDYANGTFYIGLVTTGGDAYECPHGGRFMVSSSAANRDGLVRTATAAMLGGKDVSVSWTRSGSHCVVNAIAVKQ